LVLEHQIYSSVYTGMSIIEITLLPSAASKLYDWKILAALIQSYCN